MKVMEKLNNLFKKRNKSAVSVMNSMEMQNFSQSDNDYARTNSIDESGRKTNQSFNGISNLKAPTPRATKSVSSLDSNKIHEEIIKTFETFYAQESESMLAAIEQSREEMRLSVLEFIEEQAKYKEQLTKASQGRYDVRRRKENAIPLSEYIRRKKEIIAPERSKSRALEGQHPSEREAVEKYLRKRDRRKVASRNQQNRQVNEEQLQTESKKIIENLQGMDLNAEKERDRQAEIIKQKLEEKKNRKDATQIATDIIDTYQDSELAQERERIAQKEKLEARLSAVRSRRSAAPSAIDTPKAVADIDI